MRLIRRPEGGFRLEGAAPTPVEAVPQAGGYEVSGGGAPWTLGWSDGERGWILSAVEGGTEVEVGRTTAASLEPQLAPSSVLLADGRLFRLSWSGATAPRVELARWDVPGAYLVATGAGGAWEIERTVAGKALDAPLALLVLTCVEIGRLDGWCETESR